MADTDTDTPACTPGAASPPPARSTMYAHCFDCTLKRGGDMSHTERLIHVAQK